MKDCPCGQASAFTDCCGPYLRGTAYPDTAEDLMRSRYSAHCQRNWPYLIKTLCGAERKHESIANIQTDTVWTSLEILGTHEGGIGDTTGEVEFIARYKEGDEEHAHHERARFLREGGRWVYTGEKSEVFQQESPVEPVKTFVREEPKVGRNDPCPCGSGKKYKKCCGK